MRLAALIAVFHFLPAVLAADPRSSSQPRADPYEHPANAAQDDQEQREAQCRRLKSCDRCTLADGCGWCVDKLISGDGTTAHIMATCVAGNQTFPGAVPDTRVIIISYAHVLTSQYGTYQPTGECLCFGLLKVKTATRARCQNNPAVVIPALPLWALLLEHLSRSILNSRSKPVLAPHQTRISVAILMRQRHLQHRLCLC